MCGSKATNTKNILNTFKSTALYFGLVLYTGRTLFKCNYWVQCAFITSSLHNIA